MVGTALPQGSDLTGIFGGPEITASAETVGGKCGDNAYWSFDKETGKLTITGMGEMTSARWRNSYRDDITSVEIENGITKICEKAFDSCGRLASVTIPETVETIGDYAFSYCHALEQVNILEGSRTVSADVLSVFPYCEKLTSVVVPSSVTEIEANALRNIENLKTVYMLCDPVYLTWDFPDENYIRYSSEEGKKVDVYVPYAQLWLCSTGVFPQRIGK